MQICFDVLGADIGSWQLLDVCNDLVIVACSSPNQPQHLVSCGLYSVGQVCNRANAVSLDLEPTFYTQRRSSIPNTHRHSRKRFSGKYYSVIYYSIQYSITIKPTPLEQELV